MSIESKAQSFGILGELVTGAVIGGIPFGICWALVHVSPYFLLAGFLWLMLACIFCAIGSSRKESQIIYSVLGLISLAVSVAWFFKPSLLPFL